MIPINIVLVAHHVCMRAFLHLDSENRFCKRNRYYAIAVTSLPPGDDSNAEATPDMSDMDVPVAVHGTPLPAAVWNWAQPSTS